MALFILSCLFTCTYSFWNSLSHLFLTSWTGAGRSIHVTLNSLYPAVHHSISNVYGNRLVNYLSSLQDVIFEDKECFLLSFVLLAPSKVPSILSKSNKYWITEWNNKEWKESISFEQHNPIFMRGCQNSIGRSHHAMGSPSLTHTPYYRHNDISPTYFPAVVEVANV